MVVTELRLVCLNDLYLELLCFILPGLLPIRQGAVNYTLDREGPILSLTNR
jgi:hypothetical protein